MKAWAVSACGVIGLVWYAPNLAAQAWFTQGKVMDNPTLLSMYAGQP